MSNQLGSTSKGTEVSRRSREARLQNAGQGTDANYFSVDGVSANFGVTGGHRIRFGMVEKHQQEISALNERLMKAQEQERVRIAGESAPGRGTTIRVVVPFR